ncbi:hypothetical protein PP7435_CHR1-0548 [Komagataella phaffii CBS 7435]|uniref:Protein binding phosphatidylinositol 3-phosphate n=2 Tax=Komagataella phaffii TaxID=460519 RepID=C4QWI1_KOMPG|nr:Protein binding phosphatidylinositol 3-phosphate [Komagataella phaffii GS115]AOA61403.1 GQ67_02816T0 [Komagataella phaffii]CAH2446289.1 hypothetical protein BQ9382_C1-2830 [Komagataella phaffii CBS 7435]AOA66862.1 GQ68_02432T0 [Komagataella phaffii GS115]CAY67604.1 Protein binding phosphatidylinositol 3-phosphate [Komagataella phaffii GS115]CCA36698.1 hypothetical protein PP7435_CHR1-0548 [Komagataella phaffii CBS 7435]
MTQPTSSVSQVDEEEAQNSRNLTTEALKKLGSMSLYTNNSNSVETNGSEDLGLRPMDSKFQRAADEGLQYFHSSYKNSSSPHHSLTTSDSLPVSNSVKYIREKRIQKKQDSVQSLDRMMDTTLETPALEVADPRGNSVRQFQYEVSAGSLSTREEEQPDSSETESFVNPSPPSQTPSIRPLKQINTQRKPMYTPAVLRTTTEFASLHDNLPYQNSPELSRYRDINLKHKLRQTNRIGLHPQFHNSATEQPSKKSWTSLPTKLMSRTPSTSCASLATSVEASDHNAPTKRHWKPDNSRFNCFRCGRFFHFLTNSRRKHHCRYCGEIFCSDCLSNFIYLDCDAEFVLIGTDTDDKLADDQSTVEQEKFLSKVCYDCFMKYEVFLRENISSLRRQNNDTMDTPNTWHMNDLERRPSRYASGSETVVGSVPADWNWSSF